MINLDSLIEWILATLGGGSLGAAITYILTLKSKQKIANADAEVAQTKAEHEKLDLKQDRYDYLQQTLDKYQKDYYELDKKFRNELDLVRNNINEISKNNAQAIADKCNEIAGLKAKITYLKGIRCYEFTCPNRVKENPDKNEE